MIHALTIDVEDYWSVFYRDRLGRPECRPTEAVVRNTETLLALFAAHDVQATFFILGEVAEAFPSLIRKISAAGHELGVHGFHHRQIFKLTPESLRAELSDARNRIEDAAGEPAPGHRAPAFSIRPDTQWGLQVIAELGFRYDSSISPARTSRYGWQNFPLDIHEMTLPDGQRLIEAPMSAVRIFGRWAPVCGGGYLRHFPYAYTRWAMRRIARTHPAIVYLHPYEIELDPAPADISAAIPAAPKDVRRFHKYQLRNRQTVTKKMQYLLKEFSFAPLGKIICTALHSQASRPTSIA